MGTRGTFRGIVLKTYWFRVNGEEVAVSVEESQGALRVSTSGSAHSVDAVEVIPGWYSLLVDGRCHDLGVRDRGERWTLVLDGETHVVEISGIARPNPADLRRATARGSDELRAPMPGLVVDVPVGEGAQVTMGQPLLIMEAMKMQMEIRATRAGRVRRVHVASGQEVAEGQVLVTLE